MLRKFLKLIAWLFAAVVLLIIAFVIYVKVDSSMSPPTEVVSNFEQMEILEPDSGFYTLGKNWFRKSSSGLYEVYIEGNAYDRGIAYGRLTEDLVYQQEKVFTQQIQRLIPNSIWLQVLKVFVGWFNRDLDEFLPQENKLEIYGVSKSTSNEFDYIAPPYQRQMNYHGAHDIGHALQNMSLVGCTSFATWADESEDSTLIIGRNFDFYVGDDFAKDKVVAFFKPDSGHAFMMLTFGGMTGVLSGMNSKGLTVTLNAAKSEIPSTSATPVSIVARQILQYASSIDEAFTIAKNSKTFVAETFLIGSALDNKAAIIEKSPYVTDLVFSERSSLICTNHFQGEKLGNSDLNTEHKRTSASVYRYQRVEELLIKDVRNSVAKTAMILRNQKGLADENIGMGNEKSICQLVAHHGIIFQPQKKLVWVSTAPWQLGKMVCYDLNVIFNETKTTNAECFIDSSTITADDFLNTTSYLDYIKFSPYRFVFDQHPNVVPDSLIHWNPELYQTYMISGDYYYEKKDFVSAEKMYATGLTKEIATWNEAEYLKGKIEECKSKQK